MLRVMVVEDNEKLRPALVEGLKEGGAVEIVHSCTSGEAAFEYCLAGGERNSAAAVETAEEPELQAILMDVQLAGG
ncbi:MAG: hypothetical protein RIF32_05860, partial [Leptospirales bacterium]